MNLTEELFSLQDLSYKAFHQKLIPNVNPDTVIGIRIPQLQKFAKKMAADADAFLSHLPHFYYEENQLHAILISRLKSYEQCIEQLRRFLPYVDNWATCDAIRPKCFFRHKTELLTEIGKWLQSSHTYTVRFAIEMLMVHYLDEDFDPFCCEMVSKVTSEEYYVQMMVAWYFATALAKQWKMAVSYLEQNRLPLWVHNKTIQKAVESYRITGEQKAYLRSLKRR